MPATSSQYFEQMQAELQSGESNVDVIAGDVTWAAQFAANGYILDLSERFSDRMKESHLDGPCKPSSTKARPGASRGSPTPGCSFTAGTCWRGPVSPNRPRRGPI